MVIHGTLLQCDRQTHNSSTAQHGMDLCLFVFVCLFVWLVFVVVVFLYMLKLCSKKHFLVNFMLEQQHQ